MYIILLIIIIIIILLGNGRRENISSKRFPRKIYRSGNYIFDDVLSSRLNLNEYWRWKLDSPDCKSYHQCYR